MTRYFALTLGILVFGFALPAKAQALDLSGKWTINTTLYLPATANPCHYSGQGILYQNGMNLSGTMYQHLLDGPAGCSSILDFSVTALVDKTGCITGVFSGAPGEASFASCPGKATDSQDGSLSFTSGDYAGTGGTFSALKVVPVVEIPTLSSLGLALLSLLTLALGSWLLLRLAQTKPAASKPT